MKITPSLAGALGEDASNWLIYQKQLNAPATVADLFAAIASDHEDFRDVVFDPGKNKLNDLVIVVRNHTLINPSDITVSTLEDGDVVILLPAYMGG